MRNRYYGNIQIDLDEWLDDDFVEPENPARRENSRGSKHRQERRQDKGKKPQSLLNDIILLLLKIGLVSVFLIFMNMFFFGVAQARDTSMSPAAKEGDIVIYYRSDKDYSNGDVVVLDYNGKTQIRRVVAVAGDTVDISPDGGLIINGSMQIENSLYTQTLPYTEGITFPVTVKEGAVFVLGDNRENAEDSRIYGTVNESATKGTVMTVIRRRGI